MIRLAVSDLDGTLLTPERRLPENTFEIIRKLKEKGIVFGAASGRQLQNLIDFFAPVADDIVIIAENGGLGWMRGELLFCNAVPPEKVEKTLQAVHGSEGLFPLLCAPTRLLRGFETAFRKLRERLVHAHRRRQIYGRSQRAFPSARSPSMTRSARKRTGYASFRNFCPISASFSRAWTGWTFPKKA